MFVGVRLLKGLVSIIWIGMRARTAESRPAPNVNLTTTAIRGGSAGVHGSRVGGPVTK